MYLPEDVKIIINTLNQHGYEAYAVGGCVRDSVLGREPGDWDITTSAMPEDTKLIFPKTFDTGIEHGTVTVLINGTGYEVTTYRIDGKYEDSRHPSEVVFTRNLREDLLRRDFTINAMAYNEQNGLVDIFGGLEDIQKKQIKCVGNAEERFGEDALRILRAIRFSAQLGFEIEEKTMQGIQKLAPTLRNISAERIQVEIVKLLCSPNPTYIAKAYELGVTAVIFPELDAMMHTTQENPHHCTTVGAHALAMLEYVGADKKMRLAALLHDIAKPQTKKLDTHGIAHFYKHHIIGADMVKTILRRWKFDNDTIRVVTHLVRFHNQPIEVDRKAVRYALHRIGVELFPSYLELVQAEIMAQSEYRREEKLKKLECIHRLYLSIIENQECVTLRQLKVNGNDLLEHGVKQGKEIGIVLNQLLDKVIQDPSLNTRHQLLAFIQKQKF